LCTKVVTIFALFTHFEPRNSKSRSHFNSTPAIFNNFKSINLDAHEFDINANSILIVIRTVQSPKCIVWCAVDFTSDLVWVPHTHPIMGDVNVFPWVKKKEKKDTYHRYLHYLNNYRCNLKKPTYSCVFCIILLIK
jgi:hypothetical protein